jgi:hypothetical protein
MEPWFITRISAAKCRAVARSWVVGATVYVSYRHGTHGVQRGPWHSHLNRFFGVEHQLRYGLVDPIDDSDAELTFTADLGPLRRGTTLRFPVAGNEHSRSYLPVKPDGAEVIAVDAHGRAALLRRRIGAGQIVLSTYPLEHLVAATPGANPGDTPRLYDALAEVAGVRRAVRVDDRRVVAGTLLHDDGRRFVIIISQSEAPLTLKPVTVGGQLADLATGEPVDGVELAPYGARVLRLDESPSGE